jgi:hypothetical protein
MGINIVGDLLLISPWHVPDALPFTADILPNEIAFVGADNLSSSETRQACAPTYTPTPAASPIWQAILLRLPLAILLAALAVALVSLFKINLPRLQSASRKIGLSLIVLFVSLLLPPFAHSLTHRAAPELCFTPSLALDANVAVQYDVQLGKAALSALADAAESEARIDVLHGFNAADLANGGIWLENNGRRIFLTPGRPTTVPTDDLLSMISPEGVLRLKARALESATYVAAWQSSDLPGRSLLLRQNGIVYPTRQVVLPIFELHVRSRSATKEIRVILY